MARGRVPRDADALGGRRGRVGAEAAASDPLAAAGRAGPESDPLSPRRGERVRGAPLEARGTRGAGTPSPLPGRAAAPLIPSPPGRGERVRVRGRPHQALGTPGAGTPSPQPSPSRERGPDRGRGPSYTGRGDGSACRPGQAGAPNSWPGARRRATVNAAQQLGKPVQVRRCPATVSPAARAAEASQNTGLRDVANLRGQATACRARLRRTGMAPTLPLAPEGRFRGA